MEEVGPDWKPTACAQGSSFGISFRYWKGHSEMNSVRRGGGSGGAAWKPVSLQSEKQLFALQAGSM